MNAKTFQACLAETLYCFIIIMHVFDCGRSICFACGCFRVTNILKVYMSPSLSHTASKQYRIPNAICSEMWWLHCVHWDVIDYHTRLQTITTFHAVSLLPCCTVLENPPVSEKTIVMVSPVMPIQNISLLCYSYWIKSIRFLKQYMCAPTMKMQHTFHREAKMIKLTRRTYNLP